MLNLIVNLANPEAQFQQLARSRVYKPYRLTVSCLLSFGPALGLLELELRRLRRRGRMNPA
jgi:hypothetical protein